jgi:hypothetical protein
MEVYSDRISIEQDEQERLRFSPDDILRLPVHQAINLWVAGGVPRAGFVGHTLPMEPLHDGSVEQRHCDAQHERGAHHPEKLPDLLAYDEDEPTPPNRTPPASPQNGARAGTPSADPPEDEDGQTRFEDLGT